MEVDAELSHMDRLTQTQNSIDDLVRITYSSLSYLARKANFRQINPNFPVTQSIPGADPDDVFEANRKELVSDFLRKAKQLEFLIDALPASAPALSAARGTKDDDDEFRQLEDEMQAVNKEYLDVLAQAEALHSQLQSSLHAALESRSVASAPALAAAPASTTHPAT
ncbi:hypothetical protein JCM3770_006988 [Rhodotorula araucariae]